MNIWTRAEEAIEHEGNGDTNGCWCTWNDRQRFYKVSESLRNQRTSPDYCITKIGSDTEKSHEDFRILAVTQPPVKNYQLTLVGKFLKGIK